MVLVGIQPFVAGLYLAPVFARVPSCPPQTIISLPVHTAVCHSRPSGALVVLVAVQLSCSDSSSGLLESEFEQEQVREENVFW